MATKQETQNGLLQVWGHPASTKGSLTTTADQIAVNATSIPAKHFVELDAVFPSRLLVRWPAAAEAAAYAQDHPELSLGLHVDLGEWTYDNGEWFPLYTVVPTPDQRGNSDEPSSPAANSMRLYASEEKRSSRSTSDSAMSGHAR